MKQLPHRTLEICLTLAVCAAASAPALAADPVCSQITSVTQRLWNLPFHIYMTETQTITNPAMAKVAGQIDMGGTKQSEEISTGKSIYVLNRGRWIDMQTSFAEMQKDKDSDADSKKALEDSKCQSLADESMYGQPAKVYLQSNPGVGIATKLWVSKATNLPIRTDTNTDQGPLKILTVSRYEYGGVQAPAHAITMKEMVQLGQR
jgi:hypothetical protein